MMDGPGDGSGGGDGGQTLNRGELQHRAVRGAFWTTAHVIISLPIAFVVNVVVARTLGPVDYGRLAFLSAAMDVATGLVFVGINPGLVQFGSKAHAAGRRDDVRRLLSLVQGFRLMVIAPLLSVFVVVIARLDIAVVVLAVVFGVIVPAALDGAPACLGIENKTAAGAKVVLLSSLLTQAAVLLLALSLATADAIWAARLTMSAVLVLLALIPVSSDYRRAILRPRIPRGFPAGFWRFAIPTGIASVIWTLVLSRSEIFILTWYSMPAAAGSFALAFGLAGHLFAPAQALIGPLVPAISGLREVDPLAVAPAFSRTLRAGATMVAGLTGAALPALALVVPLLYAADFKGVGPVVVALGIASGVLVVAAPVMAFTMARLSANAVLTASAAALVVDLVLAVALIPVIGVWGAVVANIGGSAVQLGLLLRGELRALGLSWGAVLRDVAPVVVGIVACLVAWRASAAVALHPLAQASMSAVVGSSLILVGLRATRTGLSAADARALRRSLPTFVDRLAGPFVKMMSQARN